MIQSRGRGKPNTVDLGNLKKVILENKQSILIDNKIISAKNEIWERLSTELGIKATSLHSYTVNNRYDLKDMLLGKQVLDTSIKNASNTSALSNEMSMQSCDNSIGNTKNFNFAIPKSEFNDLITEVVRTSKTKKGHKTERTRTILRQNVWTEKVSTAVWNSLKLKHAFHFKNHYITRTGTSGRMNGHCNCGAKIEIKIDSLTDDLHTILECEISEEGNAKECGKRQLRGLKRKHVGADIEDKSVDVYIALERRKLQAQGDPEPPILYTERVLRTLKSEVKASKYLHPNPIEALKLMKRMAIGRNIIHGIGDDFFFVHLHSNVQINLWNMYSDKVPMIIDATSGVAKKCLLMPNEKSHSLFLHLAVINCDKGQFAISEAITERQDAVTIEYWLKRFIQDGANYPKQVVCDGSRALLTACISTFTNYLVIEEYCDMFFYNPEAMRKKPFISKDVAHNIKIWVKFLSNKNRRIKVFYLASIGHLILSRTIEEAKDTITMLLAISLSETEGVLLDTQEETFAQKCKENLKNVITGELVKYEKLCDQLEEEEKSNADEISDEDEQVDKRNTNARTIMQIKEKNRFTAWETWGKEIHSFVENKIKNQIGDRDNAHCDAKIAAKLISEIRLLPMWTNIFNTKFDDHNVDPSSSASVECEIRKIKHNVLEKKGKYTRVDVTVEKIIKYYDGKLRFLPEKSQNTEALTQLENDEFTNDQAIIWNVLNDNHSSPPEKGTKILTHRENAYSMNNSENEIPDHDIKSDSLTDSHSKIFEESANSTDTNQNESPLQNITNILEECPACRRGDEPEGAHTCRICRKKVHALPGCSVSSEEEGYGSRRICFECTKSENFKNKMAITEVENHNGLALKDLKADAEKRSKNLYLGFGIERIKDVFAFETNTSHIPILKNGSTLHMKMIAIGGSKYSFKFTCAFDSFFQILFVGAIDNAAFKEFVMEEAENGNQFFKMVSHTLTKGITAYTYKLRAELLLEFKGITIVPNTTRTVMCQCGINELLPVLLRNCPSIHRKIKCNKGCVEKTEAECSVLCETKNLRSNKNFFKIVLANYSKRTICPECKEQARAEVIPSNMICVETYSMDNIWLAPNELPKIVLINKETYKLLGAVKYIGEEIQREGDIGHYTSIMFRNKWVEFNDFETKYTPLNGKEKFVPKLIIYVRTVPK